MHSLIEVALNQHYPDKAQAVTSVMMAGLNAGYDAVHDVFTTSDCWGNTFCLGDDGHGCWVWECRNIVAQPAAIDNVGFIHPSGAYNYAMGRGYTLSMDDETHNIWAKYGTISYKFELPRASVDPEEDVYSWVRQN